MSVKGWLVHGLSGVVERLVLSVASWGIASGEGRWDWLAKGDEATNTTGRHRDTDTSDGVASRHHPAQSVQEQEWEGDSRRKVSLMIVFKTGGAWRTNHQMDHSITRVINYSMLSSVHIIQSNCG